MARDEERDESECKVVHLSVCVSMSLRGREREGGAESTVHTVNVTLNTS